MHSLNPCNTLAARDDAALLAQAIMFATEAHARQLDKLGQPYILHPLRVMLAVAPMARIAAVLHDVLEDTAFDDEDLLRAGFGLADVDAVLALTRSRNEPYEFFITRCMQNRIARAVKIADIRDNLAPARFDHLPLEDRNRLGPQYRAALKALGAEP